MRNLVLFLWKNNFTLLFVSLEVICVFFLVQNNAYHRTSFINSTNKISGGIFQMYADVNDYFNLKYTNEQLSRENALLHTLSTSSFINTSANHYTVNDSSRKQKYEYISARVVNNSTNRRNNYLTLDRGTLQGIKPDMAVVSTDGVVGVVISVSQNFSSVMSLLHKDSRISAMLKKDGSFGPLAWEGDDYNYATLTDIPNHVKLKAGDTIVTSPYGSTYPKNILIGTIDKFEIRSGEPFFTIRVKLSTQFKKLSYVYIVNNTMKAEQDSLEAVSQKDKKD
ncbi:MAG: rod shape-determining protein MreC [Bacteroidetes bacterium]|nr:rod shape-determining protein MreC [Bacteroidota bacterium]